MVLELRETPHTLLWVSSSVWCFKWVLKCVDPLEHVLLGVGKEVQHCPPLNLVLWDTAWGLDWFAVLSQAHFQ